MKQLLRLAITAAITLGAAGSHAAQTNLVQTMTFGISAFTENTPVTNTVGVISVQIQKLKGSTANVLTALGNATSNTFSSKAKIQIITPLAGGEQQIVVNDGTNRVDVSEFLTHEASDEAVEGGTLNPTLGTLKLTGYRMHRFALEDEHGSLGFDFDVRGMGTEKASSLSLNGVVIGESRSVSANVSGEVHLGGHLAIVQAVVSISSASVEILP